MRLRLRIKLNAPPKWTIKNDTKYNRFLLFPFIFVTIFIIPKSEGKVALTLRLTLVQKVGLVYSRVGAGAVSKILLGAAAPQY
jgi:hypothetical protein